MTENQSYKGTTRDPNIILPRNEFFKLSYDERRYLMNYWREHFTMKTILEHMQYENSTSLYKVIRRLGLPTDLRKHKDRQFKEQLSQAKPLKDETRRVISAAIKDSVEPTPTVNEVKTLPEVQVEKEEVATEEKPITKEEPTLSNIPTIKVELSGEVSLLEIQKVLNFAEEMGLTIKVQG